MIIDLKQKQLQVEPRDWNYFMTAYVRNYLFASKNIDPNEVVFPMFESVPHPLRQGVMIPVRWVPVISPEAIAITEDGSNVPEATAEQLDKLEEKDREIDKLKADLLALQAQPDKAYEPMPKEEPRFNGAPNTPSSESAPLIADEPVDPNTVKQPEHPATGQSDELYQRQGNDLLKAAKDMAQEPALDESKQKPFEKKVSKDDAGNIIVEE